MVFGQQQQRKSICTTKQHQQIESLHIRLSERDHILLDSFIHDCIILCRIYNDMEYQLQFQLYYPSSLTIGESVERKIIEQMNSITNVEYKTKILNMQNVIELFYNFNNENDVPKHDDGDDTTTISYEEKLSNFHSLFFAFISVLDLMFDDNVVSSKLRIRGPYLFMTSNNEMIHRLTRFLLSQLCIIQEKMTPLKVVSSVKQHSNVNKNSSKNEKDNRCNSDENRKYEMTTNEMIKFKRIIKLIKSFLYFEIYTFDYCHLNTVKKIVLFGNCDDDDVSKWSQHFGELFKVSLIVDLPLTRTSIVAFNRERLYKIEMKAETTTKEFIKFLIKFSRFLIRYFYNDIVKFNGVNGRQKDLISHFDIIMQRFIKYDSIHVCFFFFFIFAMKN